MQNQQAASHIALSIDTYNDIVRYDAAAKNLFKNKKVLAYILKYCAVEFKDCSLEDIEKLYIEGNISVSEVGVEPDTTHTKECTESDQPVISGGNTEYKTHTEGTNYYDIIFDAIAPGSNDPIKLIINIEIQDDENKGYPMVKRGLYYCARMLSAQYGPVFTNKHYEKLRKVYSVWVIVSPNTDSKNTITKYKLTEENIFGNYAEKITNFDMLNVIMIRLNSSINTISKLIRLLNVLPSDLPLEERKNILENEYSIPMTVDSKEGNDMCNLGEGIFNRGVKQGVQQGTDAESKNGIRKLVQSLQEFNIPESQILEKVMEKYHISQQEALAYLNTIA